MFLIGRAIQMRLDARVAEVGELDIFEHSLTDEPEHRTHGVLHDAEAVRAHFTGAVDQMTAELDTPPNARVDILDGNVDEPLYR